VADEHHVLRSGIEPINAREAFAKLERGDRDGIACRIVRYDEGFHTSLARMLNEPTASKWKKAMRS
jgi:hypothetical protein